jgi:GH15 family glucan-1,4-alpha-glucosidase
MERLLRVASPLGLFAEEFDVDTGRHLGNFRKRSPTLR